MGDSQTFRVLSLDDDTVLLNPILPDEDGYLDTTEPSVRVPTNGYESSVEQVVSLLEPGHVLRANLETAGGTPRFAAVEHLGGLTLVELDARQVPYGIDDTDFPEIQGPTGDRDAVRRSFSDIESLPSDIDGVGELVIQPVPEHDETPWREFRNGTDSESVYGRFKTVAGRPSEVLAGNPRGQPYRYALLFAEERTELARRVRAQYGYLYDDNFRLTPTWDSSHLIDEDKLPSVPSADPKAVFAPEVNVHSSNIPDRFGRETIELLAELVYVGSQFEIGFSDEDTNALDTDAVESHDPSDLVQSSASIRTAYKYYTALVTHIYDQRQENPDTDIDALVDDGILPPPELLYRADVLFTTRIAELEAYFEKMRQVTIEAYVANQYAGATPEVQEAVRQEFEVEGFPRTIRHILYDLETQLDDLEEVLKITPYLADTKWTSDGLVYEIEAKEKAYGFVRDHQETVSDNFTPAELGGEDPGLFQTFLGRLGKRHDWLDTSSLGAMGGLLSQFEENLR